jgi:hypothetical protein
MKIFYYIRRFWDIPIIEKKLLLKGVALTFSLSLMIQIIGLKKLMKFMEMKRPEMLPEDEIIKNIKLLKKILHRITIIIPWQCTCLIKATTFKYLSKSLNINCSVSIAAMKSNQGNLIAHSLIKRENEIIFLELNEFKGKELLIF